LNKNKIYVLNLNLCIKYLKPIPYIRFIMYYKYTGCPLKKVGALVGAWKKSRRTKKSYTILPISQ